jgi:hypothetical protein
MGPGTCDGSPKASPHIIIPPVLYSRIPVGEKNRGRGGMGRWGWNEDFFVGVSLQPRGLSGIYGMWSM